MKTLKTLQEEIASKYEEIVNLTGQIPSRDFFLSDLTTLTTAIIEQAVEKIEARKEEVRYGMDTMYGDTDHPHPSVIFGKNEAKDEDIAILRSLTNK